MKRPATEAEYERMTQLQKRWYDLGIVPVVLLKNGDITGVPMSAALNFSKQIEAHLEKPGDKEIEQ